MTGQRLVLGCRLFAFGFVHAHHGLSARVFLAEMCGEVETLALGSDFQKSLLPIVFDNTPKNAFHFGDLARRQTE